MASTITHHYFAKDVISLVRKKREIKENPKLLSIFAQSMDSFNFYSLFIPIKKEGIKKRKFASIFHHTKTNNFFYELINYIKERNLQNNVDVMTLLYGLVCHYVLDSTMHPFVEYKCGRFNSSDKKTYKYNAKHHEMEVYIDEYMLSRNKINPRYFKTYKELLDIDSFSDELQKTLDYVFLKVYDFHSFSKHYLKSIKDMKWIFRIFRYDPYGYKKFFYIAFDKISPKKVLNSKFLSYSYIIKDGEKYLNKMHNIWVYPFDSSIILNYSFDELYKNSVKKCSLIIIKVIDYLQKNKEFDLNSVFSLSYSSGLDWNIGEDNPTFEF